MSRPLCHVTKRTYALLLLILTLLFSDNLFAEDTIIKQIYVEGLYSIDSKELLYLLDLKEGDILKPDDLRMGIKRAFLKGIFEDISIQADDKGTVKITVKEQYFIENIKVRGNKYLSKKFIKGHFILKEGMALRYDIIESAVRKLKKVIEEVGFPEGDVALEVKKIDKPYTVNLLLNIKEGIPLIIKNIEVSGVSPEKIRSLMKLKEGRIYDQFRLKEDIERIRRYYKEAGYLQPIIGPYSFKDGLLYLSITLGKRLELRVKGNTVLKSKALLDVMPFFELGEFRDEFIEEAISKMLSLYHTKGYPFVKIAPIISQSDDEITISFYIFEAQKVKVGSVVLEGVTIGQKKLKEIMGLKEGGLFNPDIVEIDISAIKEFYMALGYLNVSVEPTIDIKDKTANITIKITEGTIVRIISISIEGVKSFSQDELKKIINIKEGGSYNEADIADARYRITDFYGKDGFIECSVEVIRNIDEGGAGIVFKITEGERVFIGKTIIKGNRQTRSKAISRELDYKTGTPLNYELLGGTRQKLYRLGIFEDVSVSLEERYRDKSDIKVHVKEGKAGMVEFGVGYGEYERYRGFLDISYRNLSGMNRQINLRTELSTIESRYILNYYDPWFLGKKIPLRTFFLREERRGKNIDTGETLYRIKRDAVSVGTERKLSKRAKADIFYEFSIVETFDVKPDVILTREDTGTLSISSIRPGLLYDSRDNVFDPKRGIFAGSSLKVASKILDSETEFMKLILHGSTYKRLGRRLVVALSLKGGIAEGFGETTELPLVERFFLGGRNTVRGFTQDSLGPKGTEGRPTGGNTFLLGNLELRGYITKNWSLIGFLDAGNVWTTIKEIDTDELRYTVGTGLRYITPVGPLRLDYGYKIDRKVGESKAELHFSIGHAF